jgi:hypothetical protein
MPPGYPGAPQYPGQPNSYQQYRGGMPPQPQPQPGQPPAAPTGKGGLETILKEQLLRITLEVEIVKLRPKS